MGVRLKNALANAAATTAAAAKLAESRTENYLFALLFSVSTSCWSGWGSVYQ